jgi:hypothetical protein
MHEAQRSAGLHFCKTTWKVGMTNPQEFLESWVRENIDATPFRNKAEARRLAYECRKATEQAGLNWPSVIKAAGGDVEGYVRTKLDRVADQEAEHI